MYEYRGNSCQDPDLTGIGAQPRYFDTFCGPQDSSAPYGNYNVLASKIIVDICKILPHHHSWALFMCNQFVEQLLALVMPMK